MNHNTNQFAGELRQKTDPVDEVSVYHQIIEKGSCVANYLCVFPAPDPHIDFIAKNPNTLFAYVDGQRPTVSRPSSPKLTLWQRMTGKLPQSKAPLEIPADWPTREATMIGPEINHRNVDLYHLILNGTPDFVIGSGSIFQTWLETRSKRTHSAIDLTGDNEHFAFFSDQLTELVALLASIDEGTVKSRFTQWLRAQGNDHNPAHAECQEIAAEFSRFAGATREAINKSQGLIWISS